MTDLRLVIFDVDGTLVDSAGHILASMQMAYDHAGLPMPDRDTVLSIVGLSLPEAMARLSPQADAATRAALVAGYKDSFAELRRRDGAAAAAPLYPGTRAMLDRLAGQDHTILAVATGKSRRGMRHLVEAHGLAGMFTSIQTADDHPSKPHPSMVMACLAETGIAAARAVLVGDTTYDIDMARAGGAAALGVGWGNHPPASLRAAGAEIIDDWAGLHGWLDARDANT